MNSKVFDFRPDLDAETFEPSLRTIIFQYYNNGLQDRNLSLQYTDMYMQELDDFITNEASL